MRNVYAAVICVAALTWVSFAGPTTRPASTTGPGATTAPAARLEAYIRAIRETDNPRSAMSAYARGCAIDRNKVELHDTYMKRMLKFGLPKIAYYPARVLVRLDPNNGLAWGVVGYNRGNRGELAEALSATIRSLEKRRDDPSVLHNAGQLVAWYISQPNLPKVTDRVARLLARMKKELAGKEQYTGAYNAIVAAYGKRQDVKDKFDAKIEVAEAKLEQAEVLARAKRQEYRDLVADVDSRKELRRKLQRELRSLETNPDDDYRKHIRRRDLRNLIRDEDAAILALDRKIARLSREARSIVANLKREKATLARLRKESAAAVEKVKFPYRWDPPAVDGVVTPEVAFPFSPTTTRTSAPADSETKAAQRLKLARLYLRHKMSDKAVKILRGIVSDYGSTKAAGEAKKLLASLRRSR